MVDKDYIYEGELNRLKLINIHVISDKYFIVNGNTNNFMSRIGDMSDSLNYEVRQLFKKLDTIEVKTITGFCNKLEASEYIKNKLSHLKLISDKGLLIDREYKRGDTILLQRHPETNEVLCVYPSLYGFLNNNKYSQSGGIIKAVNNNIVYSGYIWQTASVYDYPAKNNYIFENPLNAKVEFVVKGTPTKRKVKLIHNDGTTEIFPSVLKAAQKYGVNSYAIKKCYKNKIKFKNMYVIIL